MCLQLTEDVEIKTHFDEKWNYEHRLSSLKDASPEKGLPC